MNDTFSCGDHEALVAYLYDECDPADRDAIASHVSRCFACAEEIEALRSTRQVLAAWTPPETTLGFQLTRADERAAASLVAPGGGRAAHEGGWWRQPLPAWAQMAAAVLIFASGLAIGVTRSGSAAGPAMAVAPAAPPAIATAPAPASTAPASAAVSREEIARLERRLRAMEQAQAAAGPVRVAGAQDALLERVRLLIDASEERQRRENITTIANVVRDFDVQRRVDLRQFEERLGRLQGATGLELQQQRDALNYFVRTSLSGAGR